jgi:hypothetical protein
MATLNGIVANEKSMSGVVESPIGNTIDCDTLNAPVINTQYINAIVDNSPSTLYENQTDTITIGTSGTNTINLGSFQFFLDNIRCATATLTLYLFTTTTAIINFATNASQIVFGSSTALVSAFVPTANNHLTNKLYVDNVVSGASLLTTNNTWTGTNKFSSPANLQSLTIDESSTGVSQLTSRTNTADNTMITNRIRLSSGSSVDNGRLQFFGGIVEWFSFNIRFSNNTATNSMVIDNSTANEVEQIYFTNDASPTTSTASILVSGGTTTNTGSINISSTSTTLNNRYVSFNPAIAGNNQVDLNFYTNTSNTSMVTSAIYASGGASVLGGNLNISCYNLYLNATNSTNFNYQAYVNSNFTIQNTGELNVATTGGTYPLYTNRPIIAIRNVAGGASVNLPAWDTIQYDSIYFFGALCTGTNTLVLSNLLKFGNKIRVMNLGTGGVDVKISASTARMFGVGISRAGVITYTIPAQGGASITCVDGSGITGIGGNNYFIGAF